AIARRAVEQNHRLKDAARSHSRMRAPLVQIEFALAPAHATECLDEQAADLPGRFERRLVAGVGVVSDKSEKVVFVNPDVPLLIPAHTPARVIDVRAEVPIRLLCGDQRRRDAVEFGAQRFALRISPGERRGVQPLAGVLTHPGLFAGAALESAEQFVFVFGKQPRALVLLTTLPKKAVNPNGAGVNWRKPVSDLGARL